MNVLDPLDPERLESMLEGETIFSKLAYRATIRALLERRDRDLEKIVKLEQELARVRDYHEMGK